MNNLLQVAVGGAFGALARYLLSLKIISLFDTKFPFATFLVNMSGCLLIGFLFSLSAKGVLPARLGPLFFGGLLGAYTTYSSFALETVQLIQNKDWTIAVAYILGTNIAGLLFVFSGVYIGRLIT